jgi:phosphatidyl-myo-inositol alpha-mannosyltransferase
MKIGLVCPYSIAKGGGVQEHVFAVQGELAARGHDAYIITPRPKDFEPDPAKKIIFVGVATDFNSPIQTTVQLSSADDEAINEMLEREQFDILHFHEPWVPVLSRQILSRSNSVNVATFHAKLPETVMMQAVTRVITPYTKSVLKYIHEFTSSSEASAEYVCTLTDQPVAIIPPGINLSRFKTSRRKDTGADAVKTILYVGRLEQRKGVKYLIRAFEKLVVDQPTVQLIIAGDGPDREKLEEYVQEYNLKNVHFLGYISDEQKQKLFKEADLFCSPALYGESFGIVLIEAMASGVVTVAGNNPGYATVMTGLGALSLIDPKDPDEFAGRMRLLLYENGLRQLWRDWAKTQLPQYDYKVVTDQYEEVYSQALEQHR